MGLHRELDGFLVVLASRRPVRMVVYGPNIRGRLLNHLAAQWRFILFNPQPKSIARALKAIRQGLSEGDLIGIFCEGRSSAGRRPQRSLGIVWPESFTNQPGKTTSADEGPDQEQPHASEHEHACRPPGDSEKAGRTEKGGYRRKQSE